ncbi:MAG: hypothetical protein ABI880_06520 [Acidobacteriota bacterium]
MAFSRTLHRGLSALLVVAGLVSPAAAQFTQSPPGAVKGVLGQGSGAAGAPAVTMTIDADAGYQDNSVPEADGQAVDQPDYIQSGYVGSVGGGIRFQAGRLNRYVLGTANGSANQEQVSSELRSLRLYRGIGSFQAGTNLGRRSGVTMGVGVSYEPTYLFGAFSPLDRNGSGASPVEGTPQPAEPANVSLTQQRWISTTANLGVFHNWTSRQRLGVRYESFRLRPITGTGFESNRNSGALNYLWNRTQAMRLDFNYQYDDNPQVFEDIERPLNTQSAEGRVRYEHRIAPGRSIAVMGGAGLVRVRTGALVNEPAFGVTSPTVSASLDYDLSRVWKVGVSARRDVTVLNGLSPEPFKSGVAMASLDGTLGRRLFLGLNGGVSRGRALHATFGQYNLTTFNAQLRYNLGSYAGLQVRYTYNDHEFRNVSLLPDSIPVRYNRNAVRVGLTFWFPLFGSF